MAPLAVLRVVGRGRRGEDIIREKGTSQKWTPLKGYLKQVAFPES